MLSAVKENNSAAQCSKRIEKRYGRYKSLASTMYESTNLGRVYLNFRFCDARVNGNMNTCERKLLRKKSHS